MIPFDENGCIVWPGSRWAAGYGIIRQHRKKRLAHRVAYENQVGPIPDGMVLDHLCRNPSCVNPEHLEVVTSRENTMRGNGPAAVNAAKTHCMRGHEFTPENTTVHTGGRKRRCRTCHAHCMRARRRAGL